jgi:hypothetical protein
MPAPQAKMFSQMVQGLVMAKGIVLPENPLTDIQTKAEKEDSNPLDKLDEFKPAVPKPTNLFQPASMKKIQVDATNDISDQWISFIDNVCSGICKAWSNWQNSAMINNVIINAAIGILPPGGLLGMNMMSADMIKMNIDTASGDNKEQIYVDYVEAISKTLGQAWSVWESGYIHTSIPFPGGAVCSTTMPPSPNVPVPVASGMSPGDAMMVPATLKGMMILQIMGKGTVDNLSDALFDAFANAFNTIFTTWKASSMISNIMGAGGVAPPPPSPPGPVAGAMGLNGKII